MTTNESAPSPNALAKMTIAERQKSVDAKLGTSSKMHLQ